MSEVKRYTLSGGRMFRHENGRWVNLEDYAAMNEWWAAREAQQLAENANLRRELDITHNQVRNHKEEAERLRVALSRIAVAAERDKWPTHGYITAAIAAAQEPRSDA